MVYNCNIRLQVILCVATRVVGCSYVAKVKVTICFYVDLLRKVSNYSFLYYKLMPGQVSFVEKSYRINKNETW